MVLSIEDDNEDSETNQPPKAVPKKASRVLELADGSEDSDDNDNAHHAPDLIVDDTEMRMVTQMVIKTRTRHLLRVLRPSSVSVQ